MIEPAQSDLAHAPVADGVQDWVKRITSHLAARQVCAVAEHRFGVLPLVDAFFVRTGGPIEAMTLGSRLGALGLFTPTPEPGWEAAALAGQSVDGALRVSGEVRIASCAADASIVLVRLSDTDLRLAWLDHDAPGTEPQGSRTPGDPVRGGAPRWLVLDGARIPAACVSRPVSLAPGGDLYQRLETYMGVWALIASHYARRTVRALRRAARTTRCSRSGEPFSASQLVAMDITEVEIETELAYAAAQRCFPQAPPPPSGLVVALAAARTMVAAAGLASDLRDRLGVTLDDGLTRADADAALAHVGGAPLLENELGRAVLLTRVSAE